MISISKNVCIDKLADIVNEDNAYHGTTKMKPANVKSSTYSDFSVENNGKVLKSEVGNHGGLTAVIKQVKNTGTFYENKFSDICCCYRYYFGRCSAELAQLTPLPYSQVRSTRYCDRVNDFSFVIPKRYKDVYINSFFPRTARLWNYLPIECLKSRIKRHLLTVGSF